jgi:hypothetical protein
VKLSYAFLADYAQVDSGKVHVIGGGVGVLWRQGFPAPMAVSVVFAVAYNNVEAGTQRTFQLQLNDADGKEVAPPFEASFELPPRAEGVPSYVPLEAAFAVAMPGNVPILPEPGAYVIELLLDGNHVRSLAFAAAEVLTSGD